MLHPAASSSSSTPPLAAPSLPQQRYLSETASDFVGSPERLNSRSSLHPPDSHNTPAPSSYTSNNDPIHPRRRSHSPFNPAERKETVARVQGYTSNLFRGSRDSRDPEREWTVFGQLMEDENRRRVLSASAPRTPGTIHSVRVSSPRATDDVVPSYFDDHRPASLYRVGSPSRLEAVPSIRRFRHAEDAMSSSQRSYSVEDDDPNEDNSLVDTDRDLGRPSSSLTGTCKWTFLSKSLSLSPLQRNIIKCCIAYFIGSLFTFSPYLSGFIVDITGDNPGERIPSPSGHMVATMCAVYFSLHLRVLT